MQTIHRVVAHAIEQIEAEAWRDHQLMSPTSVRDQYAISVSQLAGATLLLASRGDLVGMNRVLGLGFAQPAEPDVLDKLIDIYRTAGVPRFLLQWSPIADGPRSGSFGSFGFRPVSRMAKLLRRADSSADAPTDLDIRRIGGESATLYGQVVAEGHGDAPELADAHAGTVGRPRWRHYLAFDGDRAVGGATLYSAGEYGWCGFSSTLPSHRARGVHSALLARRVRDAAESGCSWVVCETAEETPSQPNPAYGNMRRAGFQLAYFRQNLLYGFMR